MARVDTGNAPQLDRAVAEYLSGFPGDLICARQIWYEGLGGQGVAKPEDVAAIEAAIGSVPGWKREGDVRYEKFGTQNSYKRVRGGV
ncbi:MAG: hypothetical protein LBS51_08935 [Oscillospiraceae bacterium]|jgi:hypothetical protein|nr:hypothetical protein [Oscillospiraceae bacterium]